MTGKHKHMSLEHRQIIQTSLNASLSFKKIAELTGKHCTTISNEVQSHRIPFSSPHKYRQAKCANHPDCIITFLCKNCAYRSLPHLCKTCTKVLCLNCCSEYQETICPKLSKPPYVCNGCDKKSSCVLQQWIYSAISAQNEYTYLLSDSREGVNYSKAEIERIDSIVSPLLRNGQSPYHILQTNQDTLMISEKTFYNFIHSGILSARPIDLPKAVRRKQRKSVSKKLKIDKNCTIGRKYSDYLTYMEQHPDSLITEGDTVEGCKGGKCILTLHWVKQEFQIGWLRECNDARSITELFEQLYIFMGEEMFFQLFDVLLVDNGSEFSDPSSIEKIGKKQHIHVFYAEPNRSDEKGSCEVNHENFRRIVPKGYSMNSFMQKDISLIFTQTNGLARKSLGGKTAYGTFTEAFGKAGKVCAKFFGIQKEDNIVLKPSVLRKGILKKIKKEDF